jgi:hypothetical protein
MNEVELMSFIDKLKTHDWYYQYSDDGNMYRRGKAEDDEIKSILKRIEFEYTEEYVKKIWNENVPKDFQK